jgi:phosphoribosyl 1,2-cyclic phosphodiesterase
MWIASLGSGSKGNATLVRSEQGCILIDCGFSLKQFEKRLQNLSVCGQEITAILVTHEHSDHASGVARVAGKYAIPLCTTVGTARALNIENYQLISGGQTLQLLDMEIDVVTVPHDAAEPVQFVFRQQSQDRRLGILTDSGHITGHMLQAYDNLHGLLLEFNYDPEMLRDGPYPYHLKQRVSGDHGHLSNLQSIDLLKQINTSQLTCLIAAHISQKNNSSELVASLLQDLNHHSDAVIACQNQGFEWIEI